MRSQRGRVFVLGTARQGVSTLCGPPVSWSPSMRPSPRTAETRTAEASGSYHDKPVPREPGHELSLSLAIST